MGGVALRVEHLSADIDGSRILDDVSFVVSQGAFVTVVGPNGAGKSTLIRCLDGLQSGVKGTVEIAGVKLTDLSRRQLAQIVSYVPQGDDLELDYTVEAFVEMGRYPYISGWASLGRHDIEAVQTALEVTETGHLRARILSTLSGGERQRVHIAAALAQGGRVLLLDEPTSFLDYRHQVQLLELLDRLRSMGELTIIVVTHDINSAVVVSDVVLALSGGSLVYDGPPGGIVSAPVLEEIFETRFQIVEVKGRRFPIVIAMGENAAGCSTSSSAVEDW